MSATGRGRDRQENDDYPTPHWVVHRLLEKVKLPAGVWVEPACGAGNIVRSVNSVKKGVQWVTIDLNPEYPADLTGDFTYFDGVILKGLMPTKGLFDVCITNPPYKLAQAFANQGLRIARYVVMLLRVNFLEGDDRQPWMAENTPSLAVIPNRPSFREFVNPETGKKTTTDACAYAWFVWSQDGERRLIKDGIVILNRTPMAVRRKENELLIKNDIPGDLFAGYDLSIIA